MAMQTLFIPGVVVVGSLIGRIGVEASPENLPGSSIMIDQRTVVVKSRRFRRGIVEFNLKCIEGSQRTNLSAITKPITAPSAITSTAVIRLLV
jgi:hypothetical protein